MRRATVMPVLLLAAAPQCAAGLGAECADITGSYTDGGPVGGAVQVRMMDSCTFVALWERAALWAAGEVFGSGVSMLFTNGSSGTSDGARSGCACTPHRATVQPGGSIRFDDSGTLWTKTAGAVPPRGSSSPGCAAIAGDYSDQGAIPGGSVSVLQADCRIAAAWQRSRQVGVGSVSGAGVMLTILGSDCACRARPAALQPSGALRFDDDGHEWTAEGPTPPAPPAPAPVKLIIDTDMGFDVDDVAAVCAAHALHDMGEVDVVAIVHNTGFDKGIGAVSVIGHYYGHDDVVLGAYKGEFGRDANYTPTEPNAGKSTQDMYVSNLVSGWESPVKNSSQVLDAAAAYRKALAAQPDHSVNIASIGFTTNLRDLIESPPDQYSPLDGKALVARKVRTVVWMDGMYNFGCAQYDGGPAWLGSDAGCRGSAAAAVSGMPGNVKQVFSGVGTNVISGDALRDCTPPSNPCRQAFLDWSGGNGRSSWDPIAVVEAVRGVAGIFLDEVEQGGRMEVAEGGEETWVPGAGSNQSRVAYRGRAQGPIAGDINALLCRPPRR